MKAWMSLLLCLMLLLPLKAYAEDTESQPSVPAESQTAESQPSESNPAESQPSESNPAESQPSESNPAESQPSESNPAESQPSESQPAESQPSESNPAETVPSDHTHVWDVSYTIPATCLEEGATAYGCSACGAISVEILPIADHKFNSQWSRNASGHWHACSVCGEQGDFGKHYPGPAATEEKAQICLTCGYTLTAKLGHSHKYETKWTYDETGHWYACSSCDDQKDFAPHSYDNPCDPDCNVCGYPSPTAHIYSGTWLSDEESHWDVCTICQEESAHEPHIPGEEATDTKAQVCLACGFELAGALEHVHEGEGNWLKDENSHWQLCACGEEIESQPHTWDAGQEQEDTTILYTCEDCGATKTEGEPKTETHHTSALIWIGAIVAAILAAAAAILFLVIPKLGKSGKYGK